MYGHSTGLKPADLIIQSKRREKSLPIVISTPPRGTRTASSLMLKARLKLMSIVQLALLCWVGTSYYTIHLIVQLAKESLRNRKPRVMVFHPAFTLSAPSDTRESNALATASRVV